MYQNQNSMKLYIIPSSAPCPATSNSLFQITFTRITQSIVGLHHLARSFRNANGVLRGTGQAAITPLRPIRYFLSRIAEMLSYRKMRSVFSNDSNSIAILYGFDLYTSRL